MDISSWVAHWAARSPDRAALRFEGVELSYRELEERVARLAGTLERVVARGDRVAYLGPNCPELLELLFACSRTGTILVPLNARMPAEELRVFIEDCDPLMLFAEHDYRETAATAARGLEDLEVSSFTAPGDGLGRGPTVARPRAPEALPLLLAYTSGSTGTPKGALLGSESLVVNALNATTAYGLSGADRILTLLPMFHVGGLNILTTPALMCGATIAIERFFEPERALEAISRWQPTLTVLVPPVSLAMIAHQRWTTADVSSLRGMLIGSTHVPEAAVQPWLERGVRVSQVYGLTETCPIATFVPLERCDDKHRTAGVPALFCDVRVESGRADGVGEVLLRGANVMREYWRNPTATRDAFSPDGWLRSGDAGFFDPDGFLHIVERLKDVIVVGGSNVYPVDLEHVLAGCEHIREAAVVGAPDEVLGEVPVACVVLEDRCAMTADDVKALFAGSIADYKHPRAVVFVPALPRNALGKVQKSRLRTVAADAVATSAPASNGAASQSA